MIRVALATRATARASAGMRAYARALSERIPRVAPDVELIAVDAPPAGLPFALRAACAQLVHLPYLETAPLVPRPYVAMLHDLIHLCFPASFSAATAAYWRFVAGPLYRGAARVLVADPRVADDCVALLGVARDRIRVVPLGYGDAIPTAAPWLAERPYLFYAGNHRPHKDLATLYAAWQALPAQLELDLVLTGRDEPAVRARYRRERGSIAYLGEVDDATLARRYRGALAYVQPSLAEGFGIPALEALVAGTPLLASTAAVPAIARPFAQTFAAGDAAALASLIDAVVHDPAAARSRAAEGAETLRAYTWDRFAASTAAVYREVVCP
ncbi:MAG TPA: glycosyltransferase [Candidatus Elarobacter sp.]|jgi:glycosyltransferase involved in cell wall biosynthesis|nr:glycosyltransferase [Candidatus Elarobacter sp.]